MPTQPHRALALSAYLEHRTQTALPHDDFTAGYLAGYEVGFKAGWKAAIKRIMELLKRKAPVGTAIPNQRTTNISTNIIADQEA